MKPIVSLLVRLYAINRSSMRQFIRRRIARIDGGEFCSLGLRQIFRQYHKVEIGLYTHGSCFEPWAFDKHSTIGRYCSIAQGVRAMNRNHPMDFKSTHAFFFNPALGHCEKDRVEYTPLEVANDVWIGAGALLMPHVRRIGDGAVIAAGAVVNKDVPPYAVVVGNPARVVRFRFPKEVIEELLASKWWEKPIEQLDIREFNRPYVESPPGAEKESWG